MMTISIGLIGEPAVGKTTVMKRIINGLDLIPSKLGKARWMESSVEKIIVMGSYEGHMFDGTDRLSMACYSDLEQALEYFKTHKSDYRILWEGDRLARDRWLDALLSNGYELMLYHLWGDGESVAERRDNRGTDQNISWVNGRRSLCVRLSKERNGIDVEMANSDSFFKLVFDIRAKLYLPDLCQTGLGE